MLTFDAETHRYTLDGRRLPGITEILQAGNLIDATHFNEYARERGTRVHAAIHADIEGKLDEEHPDTVAWKEAAPGEWGMVQAARHAIKELELREMSAEVLLGDATHGYASHIDLIAQRRSSVVLINWKTSSATYDWEAIQSAGEEILFENNRENRPICEIHWPTQRFAIHLRPDGTYRVNEARDRKDRIVFLAALSIWGWKQRHSEGTP